jgi:hypothetical protein
MAGEVERGAERLDDRGLSHDGHEAEAASARTSEGVYPKHSAEQIFPQHPLWPGRRDRVNAAVGRRLREDGGAERGVWRDDAEVRDEVHSGWGHERGEAGHEGERREGERSNAVLPGAFEVDGDVTRGQLSEPVRCDRGTREVTKQTLEGASGMRRDDDFGVDVEATGAACGERLLGRAGRSGAAAARARWGLVSHGRCIGELA